MSRRLSPEQQIRAEENYAQDNAMGELFELFDIDGSGRLSFEELLSALKYLHPTAPINRKAVMKIMEHMDADKDGVIDKDEFVKFFREFEDLVEQEATKDVVEKKHSIVKTVFKFYCAILLMLLCMFTYQYVNSLNEMPDDVTDVAAFERGAARAQEQSIMGIIICGVMVSFGCLLWLVWA